MQIVLRVFLVVLLISFCVKKIVLPLSAGVSVGIRVCSASQRVCVCVCKRVYYFLITANCALCFIISILRLLCLSSAVSRRFSDAVRDAAGEGGGGSVGSDVDDGKEESERYA